MTTSLGHEQCSHKVTKRAGRTFYERFKSTLIAARINKFRVRNRPQTFNMASTGLSIRDVSTNVTTFTAPFNRFAPLGCRRFVAVGNRATAIRLHDGRILLLNPLHLEPPVQDKLTQLGGVHLIASDLGHHMYIHEYLKVWPSAKSIGVPGLEGKRKDVNWDWIYGDSMMKPEKEFGFAQDVETVLFEGFITYCVAWYHKPTKTLIQSDLMMNLPCTEVRVTSPQLDNEYILTYLPSNTRHRLRIRV